MSFNIFPCRIRSGNALTHSYIKEHSDALTSRVRNLTFGVQRGSPRTTLLVLLYDILQGLRQESQMSKSIKWSSDAGG